MPPPVLLTIPMVLPPPPLLRDRHPLPLRYHLWMEQHVNVAEDVTDHAAPMAFHALVLTQALPQTRVALEVLRLGRLPQRPVWRPRLGTPNQSAPLVPLPLQTSSITSYRRAVPTVECASVMCPTTHLPMRGAKRDKLREERQVPVLPHPGAKVAIRTKTVLYLDDLHAPSLSRPYSLLP